MSFSLEFLGTGDAAQVPVYNCDCMACVRARGISSYIRRPCSALLRVDEQQWLIDAGRMDLAELFTTSSLSGILQTHYHADHAQGLLHLRWGVNKHLPVWGPPDTEGFADLYKHPGILDFSAQWQAFETRHIGTVAVTAIPLQHSKLCFGYVFEGSEGCCAYLCDTVGLPSETMAWLAERSLTYCIVDCSFPPQESTPRNHNDVNSALAMCKGLAIEQLIFTHISHDLDCWLEGPQAAALPSYVKVARDGMEINC